MLWKVIWILNSLTQCVLRIFICSWCLPLLKIFCCREEKEKRCWQKGDVEQTLNSNDMLCSFCEILRIYYPLLLRGRAEDAEEKLVIQAVAKTGLFCNKTRCCWFYSTSSGWPHVRKTCTVVQYLHLCIWSLLHITF